jgi:hypothetical protein
MRGDKQVVCADRCQFARDALLARRKRYQSALREALNTGCDAITAYRLHRRNILLIIADWRNEPQFTGHERLLIVAHDDPGVGAADKRAAVLLWA